MATKITKAPTAKALYMSAPVRQGSGSHTVKCTYSLAQNATSTDNAARIEGFEFLWDVRCTSSKDSKKTKIWHFRTKRPDTSLRECHLNLNDFNAVEKGTHITRASFYPNTEWMVTTVIAFVRTYNSKGYGPWVSTSMQWQAPRAPSISAIELGDGGVAGCTVTVDAGNDVREAYDGSYTLDVLDTSGTGSSKTYRRTTTVAKGATVPVTYDMSSYQRLSLAQYIRMTVSAESRGYRGTTKASARTFYVSWPNKPTVRTGSISCPARDQGGKVTVPISLNATTEHPTTGVRLQKLVGVSYTKASQIPGDAPWDNCGVEDNGKCSALAVNASEVMPSEGTRTWVRVKAWNIVEELLVQYSDCVELSKLYVPAPSAEDDVCSIVSATSAADGAGAELVIGYKNDGNTGTEVSWSADEGAWESTQQPETFEVTWQDATKRSSSWDRTCGLSVRGLEEGTTYHFRARRYLDSDGVVTRSPWSQMAHVTPALAPSSVTLVAPEYVVPGGDCELSWTYDGGRQTSWRVLCAGYVVASGEGLAGSCVVSADALADAAGSGQTATLAVEVTTAGGHETSDDVVVSFAEAPEMALEGGTVTAQPASIAATCTTVADVALTVRSRGCSAGAPGERDQAPGDVVWTGVVTPAWSDAAGGGYAATIAAPEVLDLRNGATYDVTATATDPTTGLASDAATCELAVEWARRAPEPVATVTASDTTDEESGIRTLSAAIAIGTPDGAEPTDVADVWRHLPEGDALVYSGAPLGGTVVDRWAPYGTEGTELAYLVALRTTDGDVAWVEVPYELRSSMLRVDFDGTYVELPYNMGRSDAWKKDFEGRRKLDGTVDGYWNEGAERTSSLFADFPRVDDDGTARSIAALARHAGPCLVRTPDGSCFCADVQVGELAWGDEGETYGVSLDATEVALAADFMAEQPAAEEVDDGD